MPFWKADSAGRPLELGRATSASSFVALRGLPPSAAINTLVTRHDLDAGAAENLVRYLSDQVAAAGAVPDDRTILIERCRDELGDWRICVLSPFGGRIHAPWAMAVVERARAEKGWTPRSCGPTTGSWCGFRKPRSRPIRHCCRPPTKSNRWCCASSEALRSSRPSSRSRGAGAAVAEAPARRP